MTTIKNIIFDLGGVLYDIRYENIAEAFSKYGISDFEKCYAQAGQSAEIDLFEEGKISSAEFRNFIRTLSDKELTDNQIDFAWNAILIDIPKKRVELLEKLQPLCRLFLYSNTNEINCIEFVRFVTKKFGYNIFEQHFEKVYYSHTFKIKKPITEGFLTICEENGLIPAETIFIDDTERHILGAQKAGLQTYWLKNEELCDCQIIQDLLLEINGK